MKLEHTWNTASIAFEKSSKFVRGGGILSENLNQRYQEIYDQRAMGKFILYIFHWFIHFLLK